MGAWGLGSDENDPTWDAVGLGIMERAEGGNLLPDSALKIMQSVDEDLVSDPGVAVLLLKLGCKVSEADLQSARGDLSTDLQSLRSDPTLSASPRARVIENEVAFIDSCIANGGSAPGEPPGARGITASFRQKGEGEAATLMSFVEGKWRWEVTTVESPRTSTE